MAITPLFYSSGDRVSITPPFRYAGLHRVSLGHRVTIHSGCWIQVLAIAEASEEPIISLGDNVGIGMRSMISAAKKVIVEEHVFTGPNVHISDHGHEYRDPDRFIDLQGITPCKPVFIGAGTWLGQNSVILPGAHIGRHCVIGSNAVVNGQIPDFSVAAGVPARVIKRLNPLSKTWERV